MDKPIPSDILKEFNTMKWVLLIEEQPLSDKFVQVMLSPEAVIEIAKTFFKHMPPSPTHPGNFLIPTEEAHSAVLPNVPFSYSKEQIQEAVDKATP